ncbi:EAL domain-containing protein [Nonomuraea sp. NPDC046570]|uniref:EAL domain-containing protein n=1 Tax=Nonomuraea sp. NPDC046570 TaxID=3155255 RepID=UPI003405C37E
MSPLLTASATTPIVDLDTGGVIALHLAPDVPGALQAAGHEAHLPLVLDLSIHAVIGGSGALAPLHEAVRRSGRRPREVILLVLGSCAPADRRALLVGLDGLRAIGYLLAFGGLESGDLPLALVAGASPYLLVLAPEPEQEAAARDPRRAAVGRALVALARGIGAHVLAQGVTREEQLSAVRDRGVRLAQGPLLVPGPDGRIHVPLTVPEPSPATMMLGPRVQELLLPAVTLPAEANSEDVVEAFGGEPSISSVILVDEYQRPKGSLDRSRFLLSFAGRYGHALHGGKPALRLADPPRTVPKTTPAIAAMQVAGMDTARAYDDLVVTDELNRCLGIVRVSELMRQVVRG